LRGRIRRGVQLRQQHRLAAQLLPRAQPRLAQPGERVHRSRPRGLVADVEGRRMRQLRRKLHNTWTRIRATKGLGRDLAVIAGLLVLASAVGGYILSHQRVSFPWQEKVAYRADFEEAPGVAPGQGQEVRMAGVPVGEITKADFTRDGRARLTLTLKKRYGT